MFKSSSFMVRILFLALCSLLVLSAGAQEPAATQEPVPAVIVDEALPTVEVAPLETVMPVETEAVTAVAPEATVPVVVETAVTPVTNPEGIPATPFAPEPPLQLLVRETLDNGDLSPWSLGEGWSLVAGGSGQMLQVSNSNAPAELLKGDFFNVAVQAEFFLQAGAAQITVRQSEVGNYTATLDANGLVRLFRSSELLVANQGTPSTAGQAMTLRLSAIDGIVRVSVNGVEVIAVRDELALPPGKVHVSADFTLSADGSPVLENVLLINDFFLWVKADESALYPAPTSVVAAPVSTTQPTVDATEIVDAATPEIIITLEPIESATVEVAAPIDESRASEGKDTTQFAAPSAAQIAMAGPLTNDNFADTSVIPSANPLNAYASSGDTTAATLETDETLSTCNYGATNTIWFSFTPSVATSYTVSTANSGFDTVLAIYTGTTVDNLTLVGCNDDATTATFTSQLTQSLQLGVTYYIQLGGFNGRYGTYAVSVVQMGSPAPTLAPVLTGPNDNTLTNNIAVPLPALTWNPVLANAHHYEIQIDDDKLFTSIDQQNSQVMGTTYTVNPSLPMVLPTPTTYYWRVRAMNNSNQPGPWSLSRKFIVDTATPPVPTMAQPANNVLLTTLRPTFSWTTPKGAAVGYLLDVDNDAGNGTCDFLAPTANNLSVTPATYSGSVLPQGSYCWRVQAVDAAGNVSGESVVRNFKIFIGTAPADKVVTLTAGAALTANVLFKWVAVPGTTNYKLTLFDETCTTPETGYPTNVGVVLTKTIAVEHGKYCWNVQSETAETVTPTIFRQLTITPPAALAPLLTSPSVNQVVKIPEFMWNASASTLGTPFTYDLQADNNGCKFPSPELNKTGLGLSHIPTPALADKVYCWRVRTVNAYGSTGPWSIVRSFTVDTSLPAAPTLTLPAANAMVSAVRPSFQWTTAAGSNSVSYLLDIDDDPELDGTCDFTSLILTNHVVTKTPYVLPVSVPLLPQGGYCWRVQAVDAAGNVGNETTSPRAFKVFIGTAPADKALVTPVGAATSVNVPFAWAEVPGATSYLLTLYDATCTTPDAGFPMNNALVRTKTLPVSRGTHCWKVQAVGVEAGTPPTFGKVTVSPAGAAAPVLTSPNALQIVGDITPEFKWNATTSTANAPFTYEMQADNNGCLFPSPEVNAAGLGLSYIPSIPLAGATYCWRVRTVNTYGGAGNWSIVRSFTVDTAAPNPPNLLLPADKAILTVLRPTLSWAAVGKDSVRYHLDIATDPNLDGICDFTGAAVENREIAKSPYAMVAPTAPLAQGSYCWRVQALDAAGNISGESAVRNFKIFIGSLPLDKAIVSSPTTANVIFKWVAVPGATGYTLKLFDQTCTTEQFSYDMGLLLTKTAPVPHGVYCWKVQAVGIETAVPMTFRKLTVSPAASVAPVLVTPAVNAVTGDNTPDFSWNTVPAVASLTFTYELMVDNNGCLFPSAEINLTGLGLSHTPGTSLSDGTYCWKLRAVNNHGVPGAWSATRSVVVDTIAETGTSALIAPLDNASLSLPQPTFTWGRALGAKSYELQLKTNPTACNDVDVPLISVPSPALGNISFVPSSPLLNRTYYWCVRGIDAGGNPSPWSARRAVKIVSATNAVSILNRFTTSPVTLSWGPISWVMPNGYYQVQVDNNTTFASPEFQSANVAAGTQTIDIPVAAPLASGTWYWRVRACTAGATCGAWSTSGIFTIES